MERQDCEFCRETDGEHASWCPYTVERQDCGFCGWTDGEHAPGCPRDPEENGLSGDW